MFRVKICGVTTPEDGQVVARAGADALGLNFYPASPRYVEPDRARRIASGLPSSVFKVGVFVNASPQQIRDTVARAGLDAIQLHGDEPPEFLSELAGCPVIRAFRLTEAGLGPIGDYLERCRRSGLLPQMTLIDSHVKGRYGGTGKTADWDTVAGYPFESWHPPLVLAGGLHPGNVAEAVRRVRPAAVDTASGVEADPGEKDPGLVEAFVQQARQAFP
jgi:phosphoribosylanthranilate isomerase